MLIYYKQKLAWFIISLLLLVNSLSYAQIAADHTMGTVVTPKVTGTGTNFLISQGRQEGNNLFHSFGDFNLHQSETATFTRPASSVTNILARVTGDKASFIDGKIQSDIPGANLYFLNPNGIWFGEHASLNLSGSFHASTAKGIKLGKDGEFLANPSHQSTFSIAPPSAFGFFDGSTSASIKIQGNSLLLKNRPAKENDTFYAPNGKIDVTSNGDLQIEDKTLYAPNGEITLRTTGKLQLSQSFWRLNENGKYDFISVGNINVSGDNGGQIFIRAGQFILDKGIILADTYKENKGLGGINITVDGTMRLTHGAQITADNLGSGQGGLITITTKRLQLDGQNSEVLAWNTPKFTEQERFLLSFSRIATNNFKSGKGGEIEINTSTLEVRPGLIQAETTGSGDAGNIIIKSQQAGLTNYGLIQARTLGTGQAGNITIKTTEKIAISNNSNVSVSTISSGKGGNVKLDTPQLMLANKGQINASSKGSGNAGSITITADKISLINQSAIYSFASQAGGGNITLEVSDHLNLEDNSWITAEARGVHPQDNGGDITITSRFAGKLNKFTLFDSKLRANANLGHGGEINIFAETFTGHNSEINVSSRVGLNGKFFFNSVGLSEMEILPGRQQLERQPLLLPNRCAAFSKENLSRFIITSRDILPSTPEDLRTHSIRLRK